MLDGERFEVESVPASEIRKGDRVWGVGHVESVVAVETLILSTRSKRQEATMLSKWKLSKRQAKKERKRAIVRGRKQQKAERGVRR
jgi:hypothetical protein